MRSLVKSSGETRLSHHASPALLSRARCGSPDELLAQLMAGGREKELAFALNVSPHTVHEHIKAIHRAFGARSQGELWAQVAKAKGQGRRTRLVAEFGARQ